MATWRSNIPGLKAALRQAEADALRASAQIVANRVKLGLRGGYTSGDFVTGNSINHVNVSQVMRDGGGAYIMIGTNLAYNLFWEVGHHNLFTGRFERVPIWLPALLDTRPEQVRAFWRVFQRALAGMGSIGRSFLNDARAAGGLDEGVNQILGAV